MENRKNSEKLSDNIGRVDGKIIEDALNADNIEKLNQLKAKRSIFAKTKPTVLWRRIAIAVACFLLIVGITASLPLLLRQSTPDNGKNPRKTEQPFSAFLGSPESGTITIDSLSKLNYYSAKKLLADSNATAKTAATTVYGKSVTALSVKRTDVGGSELPFVMLLSAADLLSDTDEELYYYDINDLGNFTISCATFFQFVLDEQNKYLASRIGTGLIDVVITENSIEPMITFRHGDKYYSCLANGAGNRPDETGYIRFSSHKYIEGFYIVKNLEQENYAFEIETSGVDSVFSLSDRTGKILSLSCYPFESSAGETYKYKIAENSCYSKQMNISYSIDELENYFNYVYNQIYFGKAITLVTNKTDNFTTALANGSYRIGSSEEAVQYASLLGDTKLTAEMFNGYYYLLVYGVCGNGNGYLSYTLGDNEIVVSADEGSITATENRAFIALFKVSEQFDNVAVHLKWSRTDASFGEKNMEFTSVGSEYHSTLTLYQDGSFVYSPSDFIADSRPKQLGVYTMKEDSIILQFKVNGLVTETVTLELNADKGFTYLGIDYLQADID